MSAMPIPPSWAKRVTPSLSASNAAETFYDRRLVLGSTPTIKYESRIEKAFNESDQRRFLVPCPSCGHFQILRWPNLHWDKTPAGEHLPDTVFYECERHGCIITEDQQAGDDRGRPVDAERPFAGVAGFHINTLIQSVF